MTPDKLAEHISTMYGPPMTVVADCMRSFIIPADKKDFVVADFSNIEGRGLAWLAGEEGKLEAFRKFDRGEGPDLYLVTAAAIFGVPVASLTKKSPERQPGKTCELAFGYAGSIGAYRKMEVNAAGAVNFTDAEVDKFKRAWRARYPNITQYWRDLENGAIEALQNPGMTLAVGPEGRSIKFRKAGSFLWLQLPSKRCLCYPYPALQPAWFAKKNIETSVFDEATQSIVVTSVPEVRKIKREEEVFFRANGWETWSKDQVTFMGVDSLTKLWTRMSTYGGSLAENVTQALCRDVLADAMKRLEKAGYEITFTVHDEIVTEVPEGFGSIEEMEQIMCELPSWANGFPITAEGYRSKRYRK